MANMLFANNCNTTLNGGITAITTSMVVTSSTGFPVPTGSQYFYCTLADAATQTTIEIVKVTAVSGTTFTIVRGQDGTTGTIFASGAVVSLRLVRASLQDFPLLDEANTFTGPSSTFNNAPSFGTALGTASGGTGLTSFTSGGIVYASSTSALTTGSALTFSSGTLTNSQNTTTGTYLLNRNIGAGAATTAYIVSDASAGFTAYSGFGARGASYTTNGMLQASSSGLFSSGLSNGLNIMTLDATSIKFGVSNTQTMQIGTAGGVSIGNTTDPGATNLSVTGSVGIGASPSYQLDVVKASSSTTQFRVQNTTTTAQGVNLIASNDAGTNIGLGVFGSTAGTAGMLASSAPFLITAYTELNIVANNASGVIKFASGGTTERMRISAAGGVSIGNTTDAGAGGLRVSGLMYPQQATTAAAPAYVKGAIYFDTTLNKLRVGGATAWETITSV